MSLLTEYQKQLLFDHSMGLTGEEERLEAERLISSNPQAAELCATLKVVLSPLDSLQPEFCPDELAEATVTRLTNAARSSHVRLEQLLADEQAKARAARKPAWLGFMSRFAAAAVFVVVGAVALSAWNVRSNFARDNARKIKCQIQLGSIFNGIANYKSEHDGQAPQVAMADGAPWWKVGDQGQENNSNTRNMWLLVKGDYIKPGQFVCPAKPNARTLQTAISKLNESCCDFPSRDYVTYSFRMTCNKAGKNRVRGQRVLAADLSPLFETLPSFSRSLQLKVNRELLTRNSINHKRHGQNVLFCDGGVKYVKKRRIGIAEDDIFTLQNTQLYKGHELPTRESDAFLAP